MDPWRKDTSIQIFRLNHQVIELLKTLKLSSLVFYAELWWSDGNSLMVQKKIKGGEKKRGRRERERARKSYQRED